MSQRKKWNRDDRPFSMVPVEVLESEAGGTLPHPAHRVLVALAGQYTGTNNGSLSLTKRTAKRFGIGNAKMLFEALRELEARGLIDQTRPGTHVPARSAFYAVTWRRVDPPKPHDPHNARETVRSSERWAKWKAGKAIPHWTVDRRSKRWPGITRAGNAWSPETPEAGDAGSPASPLLRGTRGQPSHISAIGGAE